LSNKIDNKTICENQGKLIEKRQKWGRRILKHKQKDGGAPQTAAEPADPLF
jgi:hypothetical protein